MSKKIEQNRFYTVDEVAELLPFGARNVRRLIKSGKLPATNVGAGDIRLRWRVLGKDIVKLKDRMAANGQRGKAQR